MSRNVLFIREVIDLANKDTSLLDDKCISYGQKDHLQHFPFCGAGSEDSESGTTVGANTSRLSFRKVVFLTSGKLQTKPQHFPSLVKTKRKLPVFFFTVGALLGLVEK